VPHPGADDHVCLSSSYVGTGGDDCTLVADATSSAMDLAGALCAMSAAASGCLCESSADLEDLAALSMVTKAARCETVAAAAAATRKVEGSSTSSRLHSITSNADSSSASSLEDSSEAGSRRGSTECSSPSGLASRVCSEKCSRCSLRLVEHTPPNQ
jgi:hypothetical protein